MKRRVLFKTIEHLPNIHNNQYLKISYLTLEIATTEVVGVERYKSRPRVKRLLLQELTLVEGMG